MLTALGLDSKEGIEFTALVLIALGLVAFFFLHVVKLNAPYGRYTEDAAWFYGFKMPGKLAWVLQELPSVLLPVYAIFSAQRTIPLQSVVLLGCFLTHYVNRTFIFPLLINGGKPTPCVVFLMALAFCLGRYLVEYANYDEGLSPQFILGLGVFVIGMGINLHSDHILRNLRKPGDKGYYIPHGGMFKYVSGANFFGEIVEWTGFAIASGSVVGASFAVFTACNIGPRAMQHHEWYLKKFDDEYKKLGRKAVIPFFF